MAETWRFLDTGPRSGAENMALDDVILECRARRRISDTIRLLRFDPPSVLVGYHQDVEHEVRLEYTSKNGVDVNRRLTGGGAILFDRESVGWEVIASKSILESHGGAEDLFQAMSRGPILALRSLGLNAAFRPKNDIEIEGRKISGTGGTERDGAFLFQGTLLVDFDVETMIRCLKIPIIKLKDKELESAKRRVTCLRSELGYRPDYKKVKELLRWGFEKAFGVSLREGDLTPEEERLLRERLPYFRSDAWVNSDRRPLTDEGVVHAVDKTPGGLIRVSLALDRARNIIKSVLITGDFFAFPSRSVLDLEAALKFSPCEEDSLMRIVEGFFLGTGARIPGVSPSALVKLILEAADKFSYASFGISLPEANHLYPVGRGMDHQGDGFDLLLLPYCAKPPSCKYRNIDGCEKCGECSVGRAYELGEDLDMRVVTVQNFEHLMETLKLARETGVRGFIGCCCEAFYCKHRDDLEGAGVPGMIVDIEDKTCYDLGKEEEAYKGGFQGKTELRTHTLSKLLGSVRARRAADSHKCLTTM
jgi:lipoate-protein ligase A